MTVHHKQWYTALCVTTLVTHSQPPQSRTYSWIFKLINACLFRCMDMQKHRKFQSRTQLYLSPASIAWFPVASLWPLPPMIAPHIRQLSSTHGRPHCNTITATHRAYLPLTTVSSADYYYYWPVTTDYLCVPLSWLAVLACAANVQTTSRNGTLCSLYRSTTLVIKIKGMNTVG